MALCIRYQKFIFRCFYVRICRQMAVVYVRLACPSNCGSCTYDSTLSRTICTATGCDAKYAIAADGSCGGIVGPSTVYYAAFTPNTCSPDTSCIHLYPDTSCSSWILASCIWCKRSFSPSFHSNRPIYKTFFNIRLFIIVLITVMSYPHISVTSSRTSDSVCLLI